MMRNTGSQVHERSSAGELPLGFFACPNPDCQAFNRFGGDNLSVAEHTFWVDRTAKQFEREGYEVRREHPVRGDGAVDILATRPGEKVAVEIETGKSNTKENLTKIGHADFDRIVLVVTSPAASEVCQRVMADVTRDPPVQLLSWLDIS